MRSAPEKIPVAGVPEGFPAAPRGAYIMWGDPQRRTLYHYHLIVAPSYACSLRCRHCYLPHHRAELMPLERLLSLVDWWAETVRRERGPRGGIFHLKGGEPFMLPYLWEVADRVAETGTLRLMLTTNGTLTEPTVFENLRRAFERLEGHLTVIVSLDGAESRTDALLRGPGHFERALHFIDGVLSAGVPVQINHVVHRRNLADLDRFLSLVRERFGALQVNLLRMVVRGRAEEIASWEVPREEFRAAVEALYQAYPELLVGSLPDVARRVNGCRVGTCVAGFRGLSYITPEGHAWACPNKPRAVPITDSCTIAFCECKNW